MKIQITNKFDVKFEISALAQQGEFYLVSIRQFPKDFLEECKVRSFHVTLELRRTLQTNYKEDPFF